MLFVKKKTSNYPKKTVTFLKTTDLKGRPTEMNFFLLTYTIFCAKVIGFQSAVIFFSSEDLKKKSIDLVVKLASINNKNLV